MVFLSSYRKIQSPAAATLKCVQIMISRIKIIILKLAAFIITLAAIVLSIDLTLHGYSGGYACSYGWGIRHEKVTKDYLYSSLPELGDRDFQAGAFVCGGFMDPTLDTHLVVSSENGKAVLAELKKIHFDLKNGKKPTSRRDNVMYIIGRPDYFIHRFELPAANGSGSRHIDVTIPENENANWTLKFGYYSG